MIEIRDTFQDAEIETLRGEVWGRGITLPIQLGGLRKCHKLPPPGVRGFTPAENGFGAF